MDLRSVQKPFKEKYRSDSGSARITLKAQGDQTETPMACSVDIGRALYQAEAQNGGFLIQTEQPASCWQEGTRLTIGIEHRTGALQEGDGSVDMRPAVIASRAQTFGGSASAPLRWPRCATAARERYLVLARQAMAVTCAHT